MNHVEVQSPNFVFGTRDRHHLIRREILLKNDALTIMISPSLSFKISIFDDPSGLRTVQGKVNDK